MTTTEGETVTAETHTIDEALSRFTLKSYVSDRLPHRFWSKVDTTDPGCWLWTANIGVEGYGRFWLVDRFVLAHRMAYELSVGPVPAGLQLDHLCRVRRCVRPSHLEPVTGKANTLRGKGPSAFNARKVACLRGHAFNATNTYVTPTGRRDCRTCRRDAVRRYRTRSAS